MICERNLTFCSSFAAHAIVEYNVFWNSLSNPAQPLFAFCRYVCDVLSLMSFSCHTLAKCFAKHAINSILLSCLSAWSTGSAFMNYVEWWTFLLLYRFFKSPSMNATQFHRIGYSPVELIRRRNGTLCSRWGRDGMKFGVYFIFELIDNAESVYR